MDGAHALPPAFLWGNAMRNQVLFGDCLDVMRGMDSDSCCLTFTSPPYEDCRTYGIGFSAKGQAWVDWMIPRVVEMCRVTAGLVFINAAGKVRQFKYSPVVEWLVTDLTRNHGLVCGPAPYVFHRVGIPGSGGPHYHRRDWEPVYAFARPECVPPRWSDNTCTGAPAKHAPGGAMSYRHADGQRRNHKTGARLTKVQTRREPNGERARDGVYRQPAIANHGNIIHCRVGGGLMGSRLAHENEAPFPESLVEFFVRSFAPEGGRPVLDPFSGSGTVAAVCEKWGRNWLGIDIRASQVDLTRRRVAEAGLPILQQTFTDTLTANHPAVE